MKGVVGIFGLVGVHNNESAPKINPPPNLPVSGLMRYARGPTGKTVSTPNGIPEDAARLGKATELTAVDGNDIGVRRGYHALRPIFGKLLPFRIECRRPAQENFLHEGSFLPPLMRGQANPEVSPLALAQRPRPTPSRHEGQI